MLEEGEASFDFPDQAIEVWLRRTSIEQRISMEVIVGSDRTRASVREEELISCLCSEGEVFFQKMLEVNPANAESDREVLERLQQLRAMLGAGRVSPHVNVGGM